MRARVVTPLVLASALVVGLLVGTRLPTPSWSAAPDRTAAPSHPTPTVTDGPDEGGTPPPSPTTSGSPTTRPDEQPNLENYPITRLAPGQQPPQFVVVSFDGACAHDLFQHYFDLGQQTNSRFTFFMSGLCAVPEEQRRSYRPPHKDPGTSDIGFGDARKVTGRIEDWSTAYDAGYGVGTHFLGHFCGPSGVATWRTADWRSELDQQERFFDDWAELNKDNPFADLSVRPSFPFAAVQGSRTPCLEGKRDQLYPALAARHFTYDASNTGALVWPRFMTRYGLWNFPMPILKIVGWPGARHAIAMDYNFLFQMTGGKTTLPAAQCARVRQSTYDSFMAALAAVEGGNRAPLVIGNHFNTWACGAFRDALTDFVRDAHTRYPDVRFVSFEYLAAWLDAQRPSVLKALQARPAQGY